ncbi:DUF397 domain-containing protein [Nocardia sp. CA-107356]|uniref:DUF397 domain-containing protein n=1 Tax=Nocardia sp. CA-107356 TaxID=3239972 RepID=UPI003D8AFB19
MSSTNVIPAGNGWFKSSFSKDSTTCVEVSFDDNPVVLVRDSKYQGAATLQPIIAVPAHSWPHFLGIVTGDLTDDHTVLGIPTVEHDADTGDVILRDEVGTALIYAASEWDAFVAGTAAGEFAASWV